MGQRLNTEQRTEIQQCKGVYEVTSEHVILEDGTVLDPAEFVVRRETTRFIFKLLRCGCFWKKRHPSGLHRIVIGSIDHYGNGQSKHSYTVPHDVCPGPWTLEEVVTARPEQFRQPQASGGRIHVRRRHSS